MAVLNDDFTSDIRLAALNTGRMSFKGRLFDAVKFIEEFQLLDESLWVTFAEVFRHDSDNIDLGWRSEYWGKMMRGAVLVYKYTNNEKLYELLERTVRDLLTTADAQGRITTYSIEKEFNGWDIWGRKYVLLGLQYFLEICDDEELSEGIIAAMCRHADYIIEHIGLAEGKTPITHTSSFWGGVNSSSLLEPIVRLYKLTKDKKYLDYALEIVETGGSKDFNIFDAALKGELYPYEWPVTKAYEIMSCFEGILQLFTVIKNPDYLKMVTNFARLVIDSEITILGNAGCTHELFDHSKVRQFDPAFTGIMHETCVAVTWMKLCYQLLCLTGDCLYADQIEKTALNELIGNVNYEKNEQAGVVLPVDSYSPLLYANRGQAVGGKKQISDSFYYGCCAAISPAGFGIAALSCVMQGKDGFTINMYHDGTAEAKTPEGGDVLINIEGGYPVRGKIKIRLDLSQDSEFALKLRIPAWSESTRLLVCGEEIEAYKGAYAEIKRLWCDGDVIELDFDMNVKVIEAEDIDPNASEAAKKHFALIRGPIVLGRDSCIEGEGIKTPIKTEGGRVRISSITPATFEGVKAEQCYKIAFTSGQAIKVIDYASAGGKWTADRIISAWSNKE